MIILDLDHIYGWRRQGQRSATSTRPSTTPHLDAYGDGSSRAAVGQGLETRHVSRPRYVFIIYFNHYYTN